MKYPLVVGYILGLYSYNYMCYDGENIYKSINYDFADCYGSDVSQLEHNE